MGRGNACVFGDYEGLYYIDWDNFSSKYETVDGLVTEDYYYQKEQWDESLAVFKNDIMSKFKSFSLCDKWLNDVEHAVLESSLFYIAIEDNEWSIAIKLRQKEQDYYCNGTIINLQKRHHQTYLDGVRDVLFKQFDELGIYTGAWTSGTINKSDFLQKAI